MNMKQILLVAVMMLAALGAMAQRGSNDYDFSIVVPEGTTEGTVVWSPDLDDDLTYDLNKIKYDLTFTVDEGYSNEAKNVFNFNTATGVITVKEDASFKYGDNYGFRFSFYGKDEHANEVVGGWFIVTLVIGKAAFAEGTEDKGNWEIAPKSLVTHAGVQATYSGKRKVKSVTASSTVALTPDETGTVWTLDAMPGDNVELTVEYDPYSYVVVPSCADYIVATMTAGWTIGEGVKAFLPQSYEYGASEITLTPLAGAPQGKVVILGSKNDGEALPAEIGLVAAPDDESAVEKSYSDALAQMDTKHFAITSGGQTLEDVIKATGNTTSDAIVMVLKDGKFRAVDISQIGPEQNLKSGLLLFILSKWEYLNVGSGSNSGAGSRGIGIGGGEEGETTRIRPPQTEDCPMKTQSPTQEGKWYDLQGRKIEKPTRKGVYVRNGIKVVIK